MKKLSVLLSLLLCLALVMPCALAEDAYVPGETSRQLVANAWESGKILSGEVSLLLELNGEALGFTAEDEQILSALEQLLSSTSLTVSAGQIENGVRIGLGGTLLDANGGAPVCADIWLNVTLDGLCCESSLLPGQKVTVRWETLLAIAGMADSDIEMIMTLKELDIEALLETVLSIVGPMLEQAIQIAEPYGEIAVSWMGTLTTQTLTDVAGDEFYPAAAQVSNIYITQADLGRLIAQLAKHAQTDLVLCSMVDMLLDETGESMTAKEFFAELATAESHLTDKENPLILTLALDEQGMPIYGECFITNSTGESIYCGMFVIPGATPESYSYDFSFFVADAAGEMDVALSMTGAIAADAADPAAANVTSDLLFIADGAEMGLSLNMDIDSTTTADGLPGATLKQEMAMSVNDGYSVVQMLMDTFAEYAMTAEGGENADVVVTADTYVDDEHVSVTAVAGSYLAPAGDGLTGSYGLVESMPEFGINNVGFAMLLSTADYDPASTAALSEFSLDTASSADMESLEQAIMTSAQALLDQILKVLPAEVLALTEMM